MYYYLTFHKLSLINAKRSFRKLDEELEKNNDSAKGSYAECVSLFEN